MNVDLFLDPLTDQESLDDHRPTIPDERTQHPGVAMRRIEIQRELKELEANLYDVLAEDCGAMTDIGILH